MILMYLFLNVLLPCVADGYMLYNIICKVERLVLTN